MSDRTRFSAPGLSEEVRLLQRIAETLELLTERLGVRQQDQIPSYVITDHVPHSALLETQSQQVIVASTKHRHLNWMHLINFVFVVIMAIALILPQFLATEFGIALHPASVSHPEILINRGDVLVTKLMPVSALAPKDLILVTNDMTWDYDVHAIYAVSNADSAGLVTVTESASGAMIPGNQYTIAGSSRVHRVTNVIPRVSSWEVTTHVVYLKIALVLLVLSLNVVVYIARRRRWRADQE